MVAVAIDVVVVYIQDVAVLVGVATVPAVVVHLEPEPVSLPVTVRVDPELVGVGFRLVASAADVGIFEHLAVAIVDEKLTGLIRWWFRWSSAADHQ